MESLLDVVVQFLLSTDRAHFVQGAQLMLRFGIVYLGVVTGLGLLQVMSWKQALQGISK